MKVENMDLGTSKDELEFENELTAAQAAAGEFIKRVQSNVKASGMSMTGKMANLSIKVEGNSVQVLAHPHLIFHDKGVSGTNRKYDTPFAFKDKMPPPDKIKQWIAEKGLKPKEGQTEEGLAFAVAKSIQKNGHEPKHFFSKEIPQLVKDLQSAVAGAAVRQLFGAIKSNETK
ncbi:MAG: hypothetical protein ACJ749_03830 [Flavisolibacter sp.]